MLNNLRLIAFLLSLTLLTACGNGAYPSDREMVEKLNFHTTDFARLVEMFQQDSQLLTVDPEFAYVSYDTKATLPDQRMDEYRQLFSKLGLIEARRVKGAKDIYLKAWHQNGFIIGGSYKHYVYAQTTPSPLVDSLDNLKRSGQDAFAYKQVTDNWYLNLDLW